MTATQEIKKALEVANLNEVLHFEEGINSISVTLSESHYSVDILLDISKKILDISIYRKGALFGGNHFKLTNKQLAQVHLLLVDKYDY